MNMNKALRPDLKAFTFSSVSAPTLDEDVFPFALLLPGMLLFLSSPLSWQISPLP